MNGKKYMEMIKKYREKAKNVELSDRDMENAIGGVGGANEATCPICGKPMKAGVIPEIGNGWTCEACKLSTDASDADTIQIIKYMEQMGITDIGYPIWWNQVNH